MAEFDDDKTPSWLEALKHGFTSQNMYGVAGQGSIEPFDITPGAGGLPMPIGGKPLGREDLTKLAAPAVQSGGNQSLINKIYQHAEQERSPKYPMAKEPLIKYDADGGLALTKQLVPQVSILDQLPPTPQSAKNYPLKGRSLPIMENADEIANLIARDLKPYVNDPSYKPQQFYSTGPVIQALDDIGGMSPSEGGQFMREWAGQGAATSPRTSTPQNLRNAAYLLHQRAEGTPFTTERRQTEGNRPGFAMMDMHTDLANDFASGGEDLWSNPKPGTFRENWSGNLRDITGDTHYIRKILDYADQLNPGSLGREWFTDEDAFKAYQAGGGFPKTGTLPVGSIRDTLAGAMVPGAGRKAQTEYPVLTHPGYLAADKLGITPAEMQAAMWFVGGDRTGLRSPQMTIPDLFNAQIEKTSNVTGEDPRKILQLFSRGRIPLAMNEQDPGSSMVG